MELARDMVITRLGQGVDETARLAPPSIDRALAVVGRFSRRARALQAGGSGSGATSAVRDASNADAFLGPASDLVGSTAELIDGEREAQLSFLGGTRGLDPADGPFLVVDVGGGSTEFVIGREPGHAERSISTQVGSVRLTERVAPDDPPSAEDLDAFRRIAETALDRVEATSPLATLGPSSRWPGPRPRSRRVRVGLERYDPDVVHRSTLTLDEAERALRELAGMTNEERAAIPVMPPGRGDVIVAGAAILVDGDAPPRVRPGARERDGHPRRPGLRASGRRVTSSADVQAEQGPTAREARRQEAGRA